MFRSALGSVLASRLVAVMGSSVIIWGCAAGGPSEADWPPVSKRWFDRGNASFRQGDLEDAETASENALRVTPDREEVRLLAGRIALARLEYARTLQVTQGLESNEARSLRGRAYWYSGDIDHAADELEKLVADPEVHDPWAVKIAKLARRGVGRKPFTMSGGQVGVADMPRTGSTAMIVPLELNGEPALGLIATGTAEVEVDSSAGGQPSWVSLRFGESVEVRDVPALARDLSGISRQVNAPIKILLGVNLLRHIHPTFDLIGGQFVVRRYESPPPPVATTLKVSYMRGGGMLLRGFFGAEATAASASLLVDTSIVYPVALDSGGWKKAGVAQSSLRTVPNGGGAMKSGTVPMLKLGAFELPGVPGLSGDDRVKEFEQGLGIELDGLVGSGLLANFRVTLADGGRTMWLEEMPREAFAPNPALNIPVTPDDAPEDTPEEEAPPTGKPGKPGAKPGAVKPSAPTPAAKPTAAAPAAKPAAAVPAAKPAAPATPAAMLPSKPAPTPAPATGATKP